MANDDTVSWYFIRISRIRNELQAIDEVVPKKEYIITALLGLPKSWSAFALGLNNWKDTPTFEQMWNACSQRRSQTIVSKQKGGWRRKHLKCLFCSSQEVNLQEVQRTKEENGPIQSWMLQLPQDG